MILVWHLSPALAADVGGERTLRQELPGTERTVRQALAALRKVHPRLCERILDDQGEVRRHVNIFVGDEMIRFIQGLESPVQDGDTLTVLHAVSGG